MLKMKKIMITGMAFLIAMTALAGCGNVTETETTEETSAADGHQEILQAAQPDSVLFMVIRLSGTSVRLFKKRVF